MTTGRDVDARDLVRRRTSLQAPPALPELVLHLGEDITGAWEDLERELGQGAMPPPFWAFAWLGGQALARYLLDRPQEVAGRSVLDLATGSGLCALAAVRAGAGSVRAVDIDPYAVVAARLNAEANGLALQVEQADLLDAPPPAVQVLLAGDVCYDRTMTERVLPFLDAARAAGAEVLIGDPGRPYLPHDRLVEAAVHDVADTEDAPGRPPRVRRTTVWRLP